MQNSVGAGASRNCLGWKGEKVPEGRKAMGDYEVLKRCRLIPSFLIFDSSVCLGTPSFAAAPAGPETKPSASRSAFSIIAFSRSARSVANTDAAASLGVARVSQVSSTKKVSPSERITARSTTFCNSRMLPGQSYAWKSSIVFASIFRIFLPAFWA